MEPNYDISGRKSAGRAKSPTGLANRGSRKLGATTPGAGRRSALANQAARAEQITAGLMGDSDHYER